MREDTRRTSGLLLVVVVCAIVAIALAAWVTLAEPTTHFFASTVVGIVLVTVIVVHGTVSVPTFVAALAFAPALVPFITMEVLGADFFSGHNTFLQSQDSLVSATVYFSAAASMTFLVGLWFPLGKRWAVGRGDHPSRFLRTTRWCILWSGAAIVFAYVTEPGPTLITANYQTVHQSRIPGTQFAGALFVITWASALVAWRNRGGWVAGAAFGLSTAVSIGWLLLHARRSELLGVYIVLALVMRGRIGLVPTLVVGAVAFGSMVAAGQIRAVGSVGTLGLRDVSVIHIEGSLAVLPGGVGNIYQTFLAAVNLVGRQTDFLMGETYARYIYNMIPNNVVTMLSLPPQLYFGRWFLTYPSYPGGTYFLGPAYVNFGAVGVLLAGGLLGWLTSVITRLWTRRRDIGLLLATVAVTMMGRGLWYELVTVAKPVFYLSVISVLYTGASRLLRSPMVDGRHRRRSIA